MKQSLTIVSDFDKIEDAKRIFLEMKRLKLNQTYEQNTGSLFQRKILGNNVVLAEKRINEKGLFIYNSYKF